MGTAGAFLRALGKGAVAMILGVLSDVVTVVGMVKSDYHPGWVTAFWVLTTSVVVGAYIAFHRVSKERDSAVARLASETRLRAARLAMRQLMNEGEALAMNPAKTQKQAIEWRDRSARFLNDCLGEQWKREFLFCAAGLSGPALETDLSVPPPGQRLLVAYHWDWVQEKLRKHCSQLTTFLQEMRDIDILGEWVMPETLGTPRSGHQRFRP